MFRTRRAWAAEWPIGPDVTVLPRVTQRHPQFTASDLASTWRFAWKSMVREGTDPPQIMALGYDPHGRLVEMIAVDPGTGPPVMYHANDAQKKFLREMGLNDRQIRKLIGRR